MPQKERVCGHLTFFLVLSLPFMRPVSLQELMLIGVACQFVQKEHGHAYLGHGSAADLAEMSLPFAKRLASEIIVLDLTVEFIVRLFEDKGQDGICFAIDKLSKQAYFIP
ncbi:hypothetical protein cyc_02791 [Cyclospora cayetanensis]|uniref:Uncharacterized protein n=1 Tax=Cyclospora cayetanensis TaxID=88456 RepID=A0A1D3DAY1_9EIME|nr:hypothetical protein cyc_02791 [Cyclospora cayetanensis]